MREIRVALLEADMAGNEPEGFRLIVEAARKHASTPHTVKAIIQAFK